MLVSIVFMYYSSHVITLLVNSLMYFFTCPQLTAEHSPLLAAAAITRLLLTLCNFCQVEQIPQFFDLWPIPMHVELNLVSFYFNRNGNATTYGIKTYSNMHNVY